MTILQYILAALLLLVAGVAGVMIGIVTEMDRRERDYRAVLEYYFRFLPEDDGETEEAIRKALEEESI